MADPISMIAIGAAIGGATGKFTEKAWECGERWLQERFGSHRNESQRQARQNAESFLNQLEIRVSILETNREVEPGRIAAAEKHPQFSALLQQTMLNAAQTEDTRKHELLARLVSMRLASDAESTFSLASQLASEAIAKSTRRQLTLMALMCFLQEIRPRNHDTISIADYLQWLAVFLDHFTDFEFTEIDARHLVAIACISFDPTSGRDLQVLLWMKGGNNCFEAPVHDVDAVDILQRAWDQGLAGVQLTSIGSIVGGLALDQIIGIDSGPPHWA